MYGQLCSPTGRVCGLLANDSHVEGVAVSVWPWYERPPLTPDDEEDEDEDDEARQA